MTVRPGNFLDVRQAKDIPDLIFVSAVFIAGQYARWTTGYGVVANRWDVAAIMNGRPIPHQPDDEDGDRICSKIILAKAARLIEYRAVPLLDGCACGCRGDWRLTPAGHRLLEAPVTLEGQLAAAQRRNGIGVPAAAPAFQLRTVIPSDRFL